MTSPIGDVGSERVNLTSRIAVVTPTYGLKSVRKRSVIELFVTFFVLSLRYFIFWLCKKSVFTANFEFVRIYFCFHVVRLDEYVLMLTSIQMLLFMYLIRIVIFVYILALLCLI